ncbi:MAG TPA: MBL fold metallo-hydrolase [Phycisphaerae bacterium]|nr:MBL fold metallo-hydrolase [Phycisphaerae bacterium]
MAELEFFGAARHVTGSMHLLHLNGGTFALDSGLIQGHRVKARELNESCPISPKKLNGILLSHAHIDHSGKIPQLVKKGFRGPIFTTAATTDLCRIMLADSAHIQEEDARYWNEKRAESEAERIAPLYTAEDARAAEEHFRGVMYDQPVPFAKGGTARFIEAGHILGSACVLVELNGRSPLRVLYTGDLGRFRMPILRDPTNPLPEADYLITESTYANRRHDNPTTMEESLVQIIDETRAKGGKVVIPAFSVGRTQNLVYYLTQAITEKRLDPLPIYVDSPLSVNATAVFRKHPECYDKEAADFWYERGDVFGRGLITYITDVSQSKALHDRHEPCVIISASGMCEAGRILHHLKNNIEDERNTVVIVGFQAQHTLGRRLVERRDEIRIFGRMYKLLARVKILNGFSAHADVDDFARLLGPIAPNLKAAFVVHGEDGQLQAMKELLSRAGCRRVEVPAPGDRFSL